MKLKLKSLSVWRFPRWNRSLIKAEAELQTTDREHTIKSLGDTLEPSATREKLKEVAIEQIGDLAGELVAFGIMTVGDPWNDMVYEAMKKFEEEL